MLDTSFGTGMAGYRAIKRLFETSAPKTYMGQKCLKGRQAVQRCEEDIQSALSANAGTMVEAGFYPYFFAGRMTSTDLGREAEDLLGACGIILELTLPDSTVLWEGFLPKSGRVSLTSQMIASEWMAEVLGIDLGLDDALEHSGMAKSKIAGASVCGPPSTGGTDVDDTGLIK